MGNKSPFFYMQIETIDKVFRALDFLDDVLEDYDEACGLAFETVDDDLNKIKEWFTNLYYGK